MKKSTRVMKFGGASIKDVQSIQNVCAIVAHYASDVDLVLVFSALGKTTAKLLQAGREAAQGKIDSAVTAVDTIVKHHCNIAAALIQDPNAVTIALHKDSAEMLQLLEGLSRTGDFSLKTQDTLLAFGELMSSTLMTAILREWGYDAVTADARDMILTNAMHTQAEVLWRETRSAILDRIPPLLQNAQLPVVQGFIGQTLSGVTTTLGFEGSDYTTALLAAALNASSVDVWKDVDGVMSTDPALCSDAVVLPQLSYGEAATLTFLGAKVLHAKTLAPLAQKEIPIFVRPLRSVMLPGTEISGRGECGQCGIRSITCRPQTLTMTLTGHAHIAPHQLMAEVSGLFHVLKLQPLYLALTENCVTAVLPDELTPQSLLDDLGSWGTLTFSREAGTVSLVGAQLNEIGETMKEALDLLADLKLRFISAGLSSNQITFGLHHRDVVPTLTRLHTHFFGGKAK